MFPINSQLNHSQLVIPNEFTFGTMNASDSNQHIPASVVPQIGPCRGRGIIPRVDGENGMYKPVAICGVGLRLPGGIRDTHAFWDLLANGKDARSEILKTRFTINGFDASLGGYLSMLIRHGYFLDEDLSRIDTSFFSMTKADPDH